MTNKEALEILKTEWDINAEIFDTNFHEALALAIKALEDVNTELSVAYLKGRRQGQSEERPQGEWKHNNFDEHYCNKCGNFALWSEEADDYYEVQSNFCPNCGADMRGKNNGN